MDRERRRSEALAALKDRPWFDKIWARLKEQDLKELMEFHHTHNDLSRADYELAINRMFLDRPDKPKRWREIMELLMIANSSIDR